MCTVKFFFVSGCVQLIGALACATTEEQVSFLLLLSLPSTYLCARMAGKTLCAVHRLFSRSSIRRQTMRADRQTTEGERGAQVRKAARGALETCATLPVLLSAAPSLCIAFQAAMLRVCTCVFFVFGFSPNGSHFFFLSMPTHVLQSRLRPHLVAGRTKRRDASLSEVIGEQTSFAWDFVAISACVSRSLALCQEMTDTHVVSRVCVYLTKRQRESMMGHCGKAYKALLECCLVKVASVPLKCAHSGYVFFLLHTTAVNELVLSCFPSPSPPPVCLFVHSTSLIVCSF